MFLQKITIRRNFYFKCDYFKFAEKHSYQIIMFIILYILLPAFQLGLSADLIYSVDEGKSPGTYLGDIAADSNIMDDVPLESRRLITFNQLRQGRAGTSQLFHVSQKKGKLFTAQTLDAESLCTYNIECFQMVDVAVRQGKTFMKIIKIKIIIKDVNDNAPEFPEKEISKQVPEGVGQGFKISILNAKDKDVSLLNSQISYELKKKKDEPFLLSIQKIPFGPPELSISVDGKLDREAKNSYIIQVIAKDGGFPPKQNVLNVHIIVEDINDNSPVFTKDIYNVSIKNQEYGNTPIVIVSATDLDAGSNGKISYHFRSQTSEEIQNYFNLDKETGKIFLRQKLPPNQKLTYNLFVTATDGGPLPMSGYAGVSVNILNTQNRPPNIFVTFMSESTDNTATISEDVEVGSFIAYVKVTDPDAGQNGQVNCELHHDKFRLQKLRSKEYKVTLKHKVDREMQDHHDVTISCKDEGSPPQHSDSKFSIKVKDINDVQPQFAKDTFKFSVFENESPKTPVGSINATDPDLGAGGRLTYSLLTKNEDFLPFKITSEGLISTIMSLDHEFKDIYKFKVLVKDNGSPSLDNTVNVIVEIEDKNDNAPYFTFPSVNPFNLDVKYHPHHTKNITLLKAADSDSQENAFLKYEITEGNNKQLFAINHYSGLLSFNRLLSHQDAGSYHLQFMVKDSGSPVLSAKTSVFLTLTVSNNTADMLNAAYTHSDIKIHQYLLIVIVLVAVTVAIPITAAISICILRCIDTRSVAHAHPLAATSSKYYPEQAHPMHPSYQTTYWSGVSVAVRAEQDVLCRTLPGRGRRPQHCADVLDDGRRSSALGIKVQTATEVIYEVWDCFFILYNLAIFMI